MENTEQQQERNDRKTYTGIVASRTGDKSIKVRIAYKIPHPRYNKVVNRATIVHAHDEKNECSPGDTVTVMETRPLSRLKRYRVVSLDAKAPIAG